MLGPRDGNRGVRNYGAQKPWDAYVMAYSRASRATYSSAKVHPCTHVPMRPMHPCRYLDQLYQETKKRQTEGNTKPTQAKPPGHAARQGHKWDFHKVHIYLHRTERPIIRDKINHELEVQEGHFLFLALSPNNNFLMP